MPRFFQSTIILFCLLTLPLRANLGETVEQCVKRYGAPVGYSEANPKFPFGTVAFAAGGYTLVVFVMSNKEVGARVSKQDKSAFSDPERNNILGADSAPGPWTPTTSEDPACLKWVRGDKASVLYDKDKHVLIFTTQQMTEAFHPQSSAAPVAPPGAGTNPPPVAPVKPAP
jgi:hypothetical protein